MVARGSATTRPLIPRRRSCAIGIVAALAPSALAFFAFLGSYPGVAVTVAMSCLISGAIIGSTIGRSLAANPDPLAVLIVAAVAVAVGAVAAAPILAFGDENFDPIGAFLSGLVIFGLPAFFFFAFPGLVVFILIARRSMAGLP